MARDAAVWFVMIDGQQAGPMSRAEVGLEFASGAIDGETFVWKDGMSSWLPGAEVPELQQLFEPGPAKPPPPPPQALKPKAKKPGEGMPTFDTSHFKVPGTPDESSLSLEMNLPFHKPGVQLEKPAAKPAPANSPKEDDGDWSDRTNVEMLPFGERIHQEKVASELFDAAGEITNAGKPLDLSKFAAKEQAKPRPAAHLARPAVPMPPPKSKLPIIAIIVLLAAVVLGTLLYLMD